MESRIQNSIRNIAFGAINRIVSIVFPFIVRTIFIKSIGEEYLGLNTLYSSILQVLNLADLGFASAIVASMYKPIAKEDTDTVCALLKLYREIYKYIGFIILIIGLAITPFVDKFINGEPPRNVNIYFFWILYLLNTVISYLLFAYKISLINAHQRNDITEKIGAAARIITSIAQIYVVAIMKSFYLYVILNIICSCIYNIWISIECDKRYPQYKCKGVLEEEIKKKLIKDIEALAIQKIGNTVSLSLDSIIISAYIGLIPVAIYGNYYYIISAITIFISLIYSAVTASIGNSIALETTAKNYSDFKKLVFLNSWLVGWCSICFMCLFQDFMIIWMGNDMLFSIPIILSLVLRFYFEQIRRVVLTYKDAAGIWIYDKWRPLCGCMVNLFFNIVLVKLIGVAGVAISTVISYVFIEHPWETWSLFHNYFRRKQIEYYKTMMFNILKILISGIITYLICNQIKPDGFPVIIIKSILCVIIPNMIFIVLSLKNKDYLESKQLLLKIIHNRKGLH